jgi:glutamate formiminotransferase/formiminotetrahydrofolate cyclodeaminase
MEETASESPAPGGGSISAYLGSLGTALATMVANLSSHRRGWDERWEEFSQWAEKGKGLQNDLLQLVDEDTCAFRDLMAAFRLSEKSEADQEIRQNAIEQATRRAAEVPFQVMQTALQSFELIEAMANSGLASSISDSGVAALAVRSCIQGAFLNVKINLAGLTGTPFALEILQQGRRIEDDAVAAETRILDIVNRKISS